MQITTAKDRQIIELPVSSIGITKGDTTFLLSCYACGHNKLGRVQGKLTRIIAYFEPTEHASFIARCPNCNAFMTFQDTPPAKSVVVRITKYQRASFHCPVCGKRILLDEDECMRCRTEFDFRIIEDE